MLSSCNLYKISISKAANILLYTIIYINNTTSNWDYIKQHENEDIKWETSLIGMYYTSTK